MTDHDLKFRVASAIAEQIWREQTLVANRMNRNLTFQGFMVAAYSVLMTNVDGSAERVLLLSTISIAAMLVAVFTLFGVYASNHQRTFLKAEYRKVMHDVPDGGSAIHPRPFSDGVGSLLGRLPTSGILLVLVGMWVALLGYAGLKFVAPDMDRAEWMQQIWKAVGP